MVTLTPSQIASYRRRLHDDELPTKAPPATAALRDIWKRGNSRRPLPPRHSDTYKINQVRLERRWKRFCKNLQIEDWKGHLQQLSYEQRGLGDAFFVYLMQDDHGRGITAENTIRIYQRTLSCLFKKYTGRYLDDAASNHFFQVAVLEITPYYRLRREPKPEPIMGPDFFMYHIYFL